MAEFKNQSSAYSAYAGQRGFWAKRSETAEPEFISVPEGDIEASKDQWAGQAGVEWVGDDPNDFFTSYDPASQYSEGGADVVEDTYFDVLLKDIETEYGAQRQSVERGYETFLKQIKQGRELFNQSLEKDYGKALEKLNISAERRGVGDSGIKDRQTTDVTAEKEFAEEERNIAESQKTYLASEQKRENLDAIGRREKRSRAGLRSANTESPYADYNLI